MTVDEFKSKDLKPFCGLTLSPVNNGIIIAQEKLTKSHFVLAGPIYLQILIHNLDVFVT